ncbi:MAG: lysophospholipid acyltransferase family protein [Gammaproteobacteria bacterium]
MSLSSLTLVAFVPGEKRRRGIARSAARLVFRLTGAWPKIQGLEHLPDQASVVVANHASYLDGILLTAVLPHRYRFVIKREITQVPVVNFFLNRIGAHFVERFDTQRSASDARRIMQTATNGDSLAFFPEGTFHTEPGLRRFHSGAFTIAVRSNMPLVPLTIRGTREMLPADRWLPALTRLEVIINEAILTDETRDAGSILDDCRERILKALNEPDLTKPD